jgi:hypothetical protein
MFFFFQLKLTTCPNETKADVIDVPIFAPITIGIAYLTSIT